MKTPEQLVRDLPTAKRSAIFPRAIATACFEKIRKAS